MKREDKMNGNYKGWRVHGPHFDSYGELIGPITGAWRATRYGVGMGANTLELLKRMIDHKEG